MNFFVDDLIKKLVEIHNDGYHYCCLDIIPSTGNGEFDFGFIDFEALDIGGAEGIDYYDDIDDYIKEVSGDEIFQYANCNEKPSPNRKPIKEIKIIY